MNDYSLYKLIDIENNIQMNKDIKRNPITDNVIFRSRSDIEELDNLINIDYVQIKDEGYALPADLLITGDIPIYDMQITVQNLFDDKIKDFIIQVYIAENCAEIIQIANEDKENEYGCIVGYVVLKIDVDVWIWFPLFVGKEKAVVTIWWTYGLYSKTISIQELHKHPLLERQIQNYVDNTLGFGLRMWYKTQLALLHPVIKDVLTVSGTETESKPQSKNKKANRKRTAKYIKRRILNLGKLPADDRGIRQYNRKALAWRVIGHYREYKDGKCIFIKPYWKGELRQVKTKLEQRERKIVLNTVTE